MEFGFFRSTVSINHHAIDKIHVTLPGSLFFRFHSFERHFIQRIFHTLRKIHIVFVHINDIRGIGRLQFIFFSLISIRREEAGKCMCIGFHQFFHFFHRRRRIPALIHNFFFLIPIRITIVHRIVIHTMQRNLCAVLIQWLNQFCRRTAL